MSSDRPYTSKPIDELESLFEKDKSNHAGLKRLEHELEFRSTSRAVKLHAKVTKRLASLKSTKAKSASSQPKREYNPPGDADTASDVHPKSPIPPMNDAEESDDYVPHVAPADLGNVPTYPTPAGWNEPSSILRAWTVLEVLSPQTFRRREDLAAGDKRRVADFTDGVTPWGRGEKSKPNYQLYYEIVLGSITMERAMDGLLRAYGQDEERGRREKEQAAIASILVTRDGLLLDEGGIAVSSFAWALPLACASQLGKLGHWPIVEQKLVDGLRMILERKAVDSNTRPVTYLSIIEAFNWLQAQLCLDHSMIEGPSFAVRMYHYFKSKAPPEPSLLNSFYLADLAKAETALLGSAGVGLRRFLGADAAPQPVDVLNDIEVRQRLVAPAYIAAARWPAKHPLVFLQQAAVGAIRQEMQHGGGIVAVNGPPGTGKTTLLRDVVAACILDRARALAEFKDPKDAFSASGQKIAAGQGFFQLYRLDPRLKGHEVVVASSNNKAVENVSKELPGWSALHHEPDGVDYFRTLSDALADERLLDDELEEEIKRPRESTWGLVAAVLGNAKNRYAFQQVFWRNDDWSLKTYLKVAKGDTVVKDVVDPKTGRTIRTRTPYIIQLEKPPNEAKAKTNWNSARAKFLGQLKKVETALAALDEARELQAKLQRALDLVKNPRHAHAQIESARQAANAAVSHSYLKLGFATNALNAAVEDLARQDRNKPGLVERVMRGDNWATWQTQRQRLEEARQRAELEHQTEVQKLRNAEVELLQVSQREQEIEVEIAAARANAATLGATLDGVRATLGEKFIDETTFSQGHVSWNLTAPWLTDELQRQRSELFAAALVLHKAFIDVNAQRFYHNLSAYFEMLSGNFPQDESRRELQGELWSTLFLVVPVISTTFASVNRMLGSLPPESLGWLLVDEAGQAMPQAAVGAIMRSKKLVIVGDPLQIPPVVSMPERLVDEICAHFKVEKSRWAAPDASVQTIADAASRHQAAMNVDGELRRVGVPLLVHRRCAEPMFGVANAIAYGGQMVAATETRATEPLATVLGESRWLNVEGTADSKWCRAEGERVIVLLSRLADAGVREPDIFVISPFRVVAQELRMMLEREAALCSRLGIDPDAWCLDRIGTVHTFQGREAYAVIFVLGAPMPGQHGARAWAANTPNIFNVAVSRAKERLYVIGSHQAWSGVGHARSLARALPVAAASQR